MWEIKCFFTNILPISSMHEMTVAADYIQPFWPGHHAKLATTTNTTHESYNIDTPSMLQKEKKIYTSRLTTPS